MTNRTRTKQARRRPPRAGRRGAIVPVAIAVVVGVAAIATVLAVRGRDDAGPAGSYVRTGEINEMGMPVIHTPGRAAGTATAAGVRVEGATWEMGHVPLLAAVRPSWELVNASDAPVLLGEPYAQVREGCCPGPLTLGARRLAPGDSTTLTFELAMHPGMDGWHDIVVLVPVLGDGGTDDPLELVVTGDFRGELEG